MAIAAAVLYTLIHDLPDAETFDPGTEHKAFRLTRFQTSGKFYDSAILVVPNNVGVYHLHEHLLDVIARGADQWMRGYFDYHVTPMGEHDFPFIVHPVVLKPELIELALMALAEKVMNGFYFGFINDAIKGAWDPAHPQHDLRWKQLAMICEAFNLDSWRLDDLADVDRADLQRKTFEYARHIAAAHNLPDPGAV